MRTVRQTAIKGVGALVFGGLVFGAGVLWFGLKSPEPVPTAAGPRLVPAAPLMPTTSTSDASTSDDHAIERERRVRLRTVALGQTLNGTPDLSALDGRLAENGVALGAPIFMRIFKREFELELWMKRDGRFHKFATYPICRYSGGLGPKMREGDKQAPEGIYTIGAKQLNPNSQWHRAFNLGFPNTYDTALGRTGSFVMIHGGCSSVGCFAVTDAVVDELWQIVTAALSNGQPRFQLQVFPFRMSDANLAAREKDASASFWRELKPAYDAFETSLLPPRIQVCNGRYEVTGTPDGNVDGREDISRRCDSTPPGRAASLAQ
jgi:murein L,D-transpeptidase YafK